MNNLFPARFCLLTISLVAGLSSARAADETAKYDLGGPRRVKAEVAVAEGEYRIRITMRPVRVFDKATNAEVNQEKARQFALQALGKHLSKDALVEFSVSGAIVDKTATEGNSYVLSMRVPRAGVRLAGKEDPAEPKAERVRFSDAFLRAKLDHENTVQQIFASAAAALKKAEAEAAKREDAPVTFAAAVAELEKNAADHFDKLAGEIKADLLLSSVAMFGKPSEKDELLALVVRYGKDLKVQMSASVLRYNAKFSKEPR